MKLSVWAKESGLTYKTAWRMLRDGTLPIPAEQLATGTVLVHPPQAPAVMAVALYARVSSADQKSDLERQLGRLAEYASREKLTVVRSVSEIGSGLNGHRAKVMRLLADPSVHTVVVEHRDRLARFGSEYIEAAMSASGRKLVGGSDRDERRSRSGHGRCPHQLLRPPVWASCCQEPSRKGSRRGGFGDRG